MRRSSGLPTGLGLRRGEIASLDLGHCDLVSGTLHVLGKGRSEREAMTIPANVKQALSAWLKLRFDDALDAPLFIALDNHQPRRWRANHRRRHLPHCLPSSARKLV